MDKNVLRARMQELIRVRHLAYSTEQSYLHWFDRYAEFIEVHRHGSSAEKFAAFITKLAHDGVSASTQTQAFCALVFLYHQVLGQELGKIDALRAKKPIYVRDAPDIEETKAFLAAVEDVNGYPTRLIMRILYGCGLRVNEGLEIRIKDLHLRDSRLVIRQAKGGKDRVVALPCSVMDALRKQVDRARMRWEECCRRGVPVKLPGLLAKKYPRAGTSWSWFWLFPLHTPSVDRRSGATVQWHCLDQTVQRAARAAVRKAGVVFPITPHVLRHAYATDCLNAGVNVKALQEALGHKHIETTMGYCHATALSVRSPLDRMVA